jgi:hypothetical protein
MIGLGRVLHRMQGKVPGMAIRFLAIIVTGLALIASAAHLFELPGKIKMSVDDYFVVQRIYLGWWIAGFLLPVALVLNLCLTYFVKEDGIAFWLAIAAAGMLLINLAIFVRWTQPVNSATANWSVRLQNWEVLRRHWEYSHAVNAFVTLSAFCATTAAALRS